MAQQAQQLPKKARTYNERSGLLEEVEIIDRNGLLVYVEFQDGRTEWLDANELLRIA